MSKKTPYFAYYYSADPQATPGLLKTADYPLDYDVSAISHRMDKNDIYGMVKDSPDFHWKISLIPSSPKVFYRQGDLGVLEKPALAIVGPRQMSPYAEQVLQELFELLRLYDLVTVSGLAPGVDTCCHELSLEHNIPTIAVLGGGFEYFLRSPKRELISRIVEGGGLIVSQYKHSFRPTSRSFPDRNRIIAGLADAIFLPEAALKSGSLITADIAYEIGRSVYAPMNSIFAENSKGTNKAINEGRISPLADLQKFLDTHFTRKENALPIRPTKKLPELTEKEKIIFSCLTSVGQPMNTLQLLNETGWQMSELLSVLTVMEMNEIIIQQSIDIYVLK